jgi:hypothetical protein
MHILLVLRINMIFSKICIYAAYFLFKIFIVIYIF